MKRSLKNSWNYPHGLTPRQYYILKSLFANNGDRKATCKEFVIEETTMRTHLSGIYEALNAHSVVEALCKFIKLESRRLKQQQHAADKVEMTR